MLVDEKLEQLEEVSTAAQESARIWHGVWPLVQVFRPRDVDEVS